MRKTTSGSDLKVEWADSTTPYLPLKELKDNHDQSSEISRSKFKNRWTRIWLASLAIKTKNKIDQAFKKRLARSRYKFGVKIPQTVQEALKLVKEKSGDGKRENCIWDLGDVSYSTNGVYQVIIADDIWLKSKHRTHDQYPNWAYIFISTFKV